MKDVVYFNHLCDLVGGYRVSGRSYYILLSYLHDKSFYGIVGNDEDRGDDGLMLRKEFPTKDWYPCSMLEMMIALAQRMNYIMLDDSDLDRTSMFFWSMVDNLGFLSLDDDTIETDEEFYSSDVNAVLDMVLNREYKRNGGGGLFPLRKPREDQRNVEIYIQANLWLLEHYAGRLEEGE